MSEDILEETPQEAPPSLPVVRMVAEDYNSQDAQHYAQWVASGRPALPWQTTWYEDLQEDGETYVRRPQPAQPDETPVTDVEMLYKTISERLNGDEAKRTGQPVDPNGAVPVARAMAATAMLYLGWHYPSEADLATGSNPAILQAIYADPTTNTTEGSTVAQKRKVLHFTLVMLEGQAFGLEYQAELGAYERTASGQFQAKLKSDKTRDWLDLPCPKMHKDWPEFDSVRSMFQAVMK